MAIETDLATGLAQLIEDAGLGIWESSGVYPNPALTAILIRVAAETLPNQIVLSTYPVTDDPALSDSQLGVQVRTRKDGADPRPVDDLDSALFDLLHGLTQTTLSTGIRIVLMLRTSGTSLGQDASKRWSRSSNYSADVWRPSTHRT